MYYLITLVYLFTLVAEELSKHTRSYTRNNYILDLFSLDFDRSRYFPSAAWLYCTLSFHPPPHSTLHPLHPPSAALSLISIIRQDKTDQSLGLASEFQCSVGGGGGGWGESSMLLLCLARPSVRSQVHCLHSERGSNNAPQVIEIVNSHPPPPPPPCTCQGLHPELRWSAELTWPSYQGPGSQIQTFQ